MPMLVPTFRVHSVFTPMSWPWLGKSVIKVLAFEKNGGSILGSVTSG